MTVVTWRQLRLGKARGTGTLAIISFVVCRPVQHSGAGSGAAHRELRGDVLPSHIRWCNQTVDELRARSPPLAKSLRCGPRHGG